MPLAPHYVAGVKQVLEEATVRGAPFGKARRAVKQTRLTAGEAATASVLLNREGLAAWHLFA